MDGLCIACGGDGDSGPPDDLRLCEACDGDGRDHGNVCRECHDLGPINADLHCAKCARERPLEARGG